MVSCKLVQLLALLQLFQWATSLEDPVQLVIRTDPPGPSYPASTWIRFSCKAENYSSPQTLHYEWRGCKNPDEESTLHVSDPHLEDLSAVVWLSSTSEIQYIECQVFNSSGLMGRAGQSLTVTGVGVSMEDVFLGDIENNTSIIDIYEGELPTLLCQSALRDPCTAGGWIDFNNSYIVAPQQNRSCNTDVNTFTSTRLSLTLDLPNGLYTCIIPDESLVSRSVYIGIYDSIDERATPFKSSLVLTHGIDHNKLSLTCTTAGLPASSVVWKRNNAFMSEQGAGVNLVDMARTEYSSDLILLWNENGISTMSCMVFAEWKTPSQSYYDSVDASGTFLIAELGSYTVIRCPALGNVEWLDSSNAVFNASQYPELELSDGSLTITSVTESLDGLQFQCRGVDTSGQVQFWEHYSIIVSVPADLLSVSFVDNTSRQAEEGEPHKLTCCYSINSAESVSAPILEWYQDMELIDHAVNPDFIVSADGKCSTLTFVSAKVEQNGVIFMCSAKWQPSLLYIGNSTNHIAHTAINVTENPISTTKNPISVPENTEVTDSALPVSSASRLSSLPHLLSALLLLLAVTLSL